MPSLDRVITVGIREPDSRNSFGIPVAGAIVDTELWARQTDYRFDHQRGDETVLRTERRYRVRYRADLVGAYLNGRLSVVIDGERYAVQGAAEVNRRKWLDLSIYLEVS